MLRYAGMASQLAAALIVGVFGGMWLDKKLNRDKPLLVWLIPMLLLIGMLVQVIRDTSRKK